VSTTQNVLDHLGLAVSKTLESKIFLQQPAGIVLLRIDETAGGHRGVWLVRFVAECAPRPRGGWLAGATDSLQGKYLGPTHTEFRREQALP
jgi:hypothetical protein